jgi:hypothetical protein
MASTVVIAVLSLALLILVAFPIVGWFTYSTERAEAIRTAEAYEQVAVQKHVTELAVAHPTIVKRARFDRHPFYVAPHAAVFSYAVCIFAGAKPTNNVADLSNLTRTTMAICFIVGATLVLAGTMLGGRVGPWRIARHIHDHPTAVLLGDDIALPYRFGCAGLACVSVSMGIYSSTSFHTTTGSLGGWLTAVLAVASAVGIATLYFRIREFERNEATLIGEVMARMDRDTD